MKWRVIIPFKGQMERKTRLAPRLPVEARHRLSDEMFHHVAAQLCASPDIAQVAVLSDTRPDGWEGRMLADTGRGLNQEICDAAARVAPYPLLVIHADLPLLTIPDIVALLAQGEGGIAIAPDKHGTGTNAIALGLGSQFPFAFGGGSFQRHVSAAEGSARIVNRSGLAFDIDTPDDYDAALRLGCFTYPSPLSP